MAANSIIQALTALRLFDADTVAEVERINAMQGQGGRVDLGEPLPLDDLLAMADVTPGDVARAAADWQESAPEDARGLLDAKAVDQL